MRDQWGLEFQRKAGKKKWDMKLKHQNVKDAQKRQDPNLVGGGGNLNDSSNAGM